MSPIVRSAKRQKLDNEYGDAFKEIGIDSTSGHRQSTSLLPLVQTFAGIQLTDSQNFIDIIGKIRSHPYLLEYNDPRQNKVTARYGHDKTLSIRILHRNLILYLGFLLASFKQTPIQVLSSLVFCLRDLYANDNVNIKKCDIEEEFEELFVLIPELMRIATNTIDELYASKATIMRDIVLGCYQIMKSWLKAPILLNQFLANSTTTRSENFLLSFFILIDKRIIECGNGKCEMHKVLECLRSICDDKSEFWRLLYVTILAVQSRQLSLHVNLSPLLEIFYWRCISRVPSGECIKSGSRIQSDTADRAVNAMMPYSTSDDRLLSKKAMVCIVEFTEDANYNTRIQLVEFITESILKNATFGDDGAGKEIKDDQMDGNLVQLLECFGLCINRENVSDHVLQMEEWEKVLDALVYISVGQKNIDAAEKAATVVISILKSSVLTIGHPPSPLFNRSMEIVLELIPSQSVWIVEQILDLLYDLVQDTTVNRRIRSTSMLPDLINALALLSCKNFLVEESMKAKLAQSFALLVHEVKNIHFLARDMSNLAFLVRLAGGSYCETNRGQVQQISISVLVTLAKKSLQSKDPSKRTWFIVLTHSIHPYDTGRQ